MGRLSNAILMACVATVAWYAYNPLPDGLEQSWKYNVLVTAVRIISDVSFLGGKLGLADERICLRKVVGVTDNIFAANTTGAIVSDEDFGGVEVRLYVPDRPNSSRRGGLIYIHGGGFITGSPKAYDSYSLWLVRRLDLVVASVHYRRVPEHPSPVPLSDAYTAAQYFYKHAHQWGIDTGRIGISGDSAGGCLAAALVLRVRDERRERQLPENDGLRFRFQVLSYPLLQGLTQNLPSYQQNDYHAIVWTKRWCVAGVVWTYIRGYENYRLFFPYQLNETHIPGFIKKQYGKYVDWRKLPKHLIKPDFKPFPYHEEYFPEVTRDIHKDIINPYNFPLMAADLSGLPPSYVMTAEFDPIRDDGLLYVGRLEEAGVEVVSDYFANGWHGIVSVLDTGVFSFDISTQAMNNITAFIERQLL